jgi:hypothetical protein
MKKRFRSKKAYFFLIDSILALGVLVVGAFLIFTFYLQVPSGGQPAILSEDVMGFLANNKMKDVNSQEVGIGGAYWSSLEVTTCNGGPIIPNPDTTLLQQSAIFYKDSVIDNCYLDLTNYFIENLAQGAFPAQYSFEFWIENTLMYPDTEQTDSKDAAKILIPSKRIIYGIKDLENGELLGPYDTEVIVWQ